MRLEREVVGSLEAERMRARLKRRLFDEATPAVFVGRFELGEKIGEGGMGEVYRARDPQLERDVAVKVLVREASSDELLREARAMARLEHPNVVSVYEAGTAGGRPFVAMELVRGESLGVWLRAAPRTAAEIAHVFAAAARGLFAAHEAGVIHRDFKPANVLVTPEGTAKVADFGLAGAIGPAGEPTSSPDAVASSRPLAGTPLYMAPEVLRGEPATAASDQFSFGVSLFEALTGARPFTGKTLAAIRDAHHDQLAPRNLPRWLRPIVARLLRVAPADRYPAMRDVANALEPRPTAHRAWLAAGLLVATAGLAAAGVLGGGRGAICSGAAPEIAKVWAPERRKAVTEALAANPAPFSGEAARRTVDALDAYAAEWTAAHRDACEATRVRAEQSEAVLDQRMACLARRRSELDALVTVLTRVDPDIAERAQEGVSRLEPPRRCATMTTPSAGSEPSPALAPQVDELRGALDASRALRGAGKYKEAVARAEAAVATAASISFPPVLAEARLELARARLLAGDASGARDASLDALDVAEAHGRDEVAAASWLVALSAAPSGHGDKGEGGLFERRAEAAVARIGSPNEEQSLLESIVGTRRRAEGKLDEARSHLERALALAAREHGDASLEAADGRASLAAVLSLQDRTKDASAELERAMAAAESILGPDHPRLAVMLDAYGLALKNRGRYEDAYAVQRRGLTILERALGADNDRITSALGNLGNTCMHLGRYDEARALHGRAIAIRERVLGPEHPLVALAINNLANVATQEKRWEEAIDLHLRALAMREKRLPPGDRMIGMSLTNLGDALRGAERWDEAADRYRASVAIFEGGSGAAASWLAFPLTGLGEALVGQGHPEQAIAPLERALQIRIKDDLAPDLAGETKFALARALVASGKDRERALALASEARVAIATARPDDAETVHAIDAWRKTVTAK